MASPTPNVPRLGLRWLRLQLAEGDRSECWEYPYGRLPNGYGAIWLRGRNHGAHRVAWMLEHGTAPPNSRTIVVMHSCDNPPCCNPDHLALGSQSDNVLDTIRRGRAVQPVGEASHNARLTEADVRAIRASADTQTALARRYGVTQSAIWKIITHRMWRHVA